MTLHKSHVGDTSPTSFSPKAFLKARRPERFSDSIVQEVTELDRTLLEHHLSTLTTRSQEIDFERFARRLCEHEICPNLLPHTGPTGGGDSKVDTETYPVADDLALAWYTGLGRQASEDRWGFAFSAKADWQPKVRSDIAKMVGTKRGYTKAFFVTSQAVPDRKRAEFEDDLRTKHGIDVRILDRTWILDKVFSNRHEELTVKELGITALSRRKIRQGPLDLERERTLEELDRRIQEALQARQFGPALVIDSLESADLARSLERPPAEVQGRYARADELAQKYGTRREKVESAYQWGWTLYWWFEDYDRFVDQYGVVEERAKGSLNVYDLERLSNLWHCLHTTVLSGALDAQSVSYDNRTHTLLSELQRLQKDRERPSTALRAETLLLLVQLTRRLHARNPVEDVLQSLQSVVERIQRLIGCPLEPIVETLVECEPLLQDSTAYNELFETIITVASTRDGEARAARLLLARGESQIVQGRPTRAIATLGQALGRLQKDETRHDLVEALYLCGCAYDGIGLPWASRGTLVSAAGIANDELVRYGDVTPYQAACFRRLKWVELGLGRLPHILAWHELDLMVRHELVKRGYDAHSLLAPETEFTYLLTRLILRTDFFDLKALQNLPDVLDRLGLGLTADALLFILGHEDRFEEVAKGIDEDPVVLASKLWDINADFRLADHPVLYNQRTASLQSRVLGCRILVESETGQPCIDIAECILAALESFLATSAVTRAFAHEPELTMDVRTSDFAEAPFGISYEERAGRPHLLVTCSTFDPHRITLEDQNAIRQAIVRAVGTVLPCFVTFRDRGLDLEVLLRDERVIERAVASFGSQTSVLGMSPKTWPESWADEKAKTYNLLRTEPWEPQAIRTPDKSDDDSELSDAKEDSQRAPDLHDLNSLSHDRIQTVSMIRVRLWDRAGWSGVLFLTDPANENPPVFALIFCDRNAGREIFVDWRKQLGAVDRREYIRLTVVRGIDRLHPHAYRVIVGSNLKNLPNGTRYAGFTYRIHRMDAGAPGNLERFLKNYGAVGGLLLAPAFAPPGFDPTQVSQVQPDLSAAVAIRHVHVRHAWEIGFGDIDSMAIQADDDPVIPEDVEGPPVLELLDSLRKR